MKEKKSATLSVRLRPSKKAKLVAEAERRDVSIAKLIEMAADRWEEIAERKQVRRKTTKRKARRRK